MCKECIKGGPLPGERTSAIFQKAGISGRTTAISGAFIESYIARGGVGLSKRADVYIRPMVRSSGQTKKIA